MLPDGPGFDRLCRDVAAAPAYPKSMGVIEGEREAAIEARVTARLRAQADRLMRGQWYEPAPDLDAIRREEARRGE